MAGSDAILFIFFPTELFKSVKMEESNLVEMDVKHLVEIKKELWEARVKWKQIGQELKIPQSNLEVIEEDKQKTDDKFEEMILLWLRHYAKSPTWATLCEALESDLVGHKLLADTIRKKMLPKANQAGQF